MNSYICKLNVCRKFSCRAPAEVDLTHHEDFPCCCATLIKSNHFETWW